MVMVQPSSTSLLSSLLVLGLATSAWGCEIAKRQDLVATSQEAAQNSPNDFARGSIASPKLKNMEGASEQGLSLAAKIEEHKSVDIESVKLQRQATDGRCLIDIEYPQVSGLNDATIQEKINSEIKNNFLHAPGRTLNVQQCTLDDSYSRLRESVFGWTSGYEVGINKNGVLSINGYASLTPGAHPFNISKPITFNLKNGNVSSYSSLFAANSDYVNQVNRLIPEEIREYLESRSDQNQMSAEEIQAVVNQFQPKQQYQFYLNDQGLVLVDVFDVHALQAVRAEIEFSKIETIVDPNGPIQATQEN